MRIAANPSGLWIIVLGIWATLSPCYLIAEEIRWRTNPNAAGQEAIKTNRPLFMDFGTTNCIWCKKMDASTLRDPEIVRLLNRDFIPVKIDASHDPSLALKMNIHSFPTFVFATPDCRIVNSREGFLDATTLAQQLHHTLKVSPSKPAPAGAVSRPSPFPLEEETQSRIVVRTTAPSGVVTPLETSSPQARELLGLVKQNFEQRQFLSCLERCALLLSEYPDSTEATEARLLAQTIRNDPQMAERLSRSLTDQLGELYLAQAEAALRSQDNQRAESFLNRVLQVAPASKSALAAQIHLGRLQASLPGPPSRPGLLRAPNR